MLLLARQTRLSSRIINVLHQQRGKRAYHLARPLLTELSERQLLHHATSLEALSKALTGSKQTVYAGIDPTAPNLHVGHLLPLMVLLQFGVRGHRVFNLIGGATGLVGDPSGRTTERPQAVAERIASNVTALTSAVNSFWDGAKSYADMRLERNEEGVGEVQVVDNLSWWRDVTFLDFLRQTGKMARMSAMLGRDSVQNRLKDSANGMSFAEFAYQLLQARDFAHLHEKEKCSVQVGGSDQFGNIVAGLDLIRRQNAVAGEGAAGEEKDVEEAGAGAWGITTPLLTTATGEKFGKSAGNAVWLDEKMTSCFDFWQYFYRTEDKDVGRYLRMFTLLPLEKIEQLEKTHASEPEKRAAQTVLADEVTLLVHGEKGIKRARVTTDVFFSKGGVRNLTAKDVLDALEHDSRLVKMNAEELRATPIVKLALQHGLADTKSAAKRLITQGGLYLNDERVSVQAADGKGEEANVKDSQLVDRRVAVIRAGKDKHVVFVADA